MRQLSNKVQTQLLSSINYRQCTGFNNEKTHTVFSAINAQKWKILNNLIKKTNGLIKNKTSMKHNQDGHEPTYSTELHAAE